MNFHVIRHKGAPPEAHSRIELCHDRDKKICWLELTNNDTIIGENGNGFVTCLIGAVKHTSGIGWEAISGQLVLRSPYISLSFGSNLVAQKQSHLVEAFQRKIIEDWRNFNGNEHQVKRWAKGTTFGVDLSSPSFVMKAIKTGFSAINVSVAAYEGFKGRGYTYTVDEAIDYLKRQAARVGPPLIDSALTDFHQMSPLRLAGQQEDRETASDPRKIDYIDADPNGVQPRNFLYSPGGTGFDANIKAPFDRVIAYGFRGDTRPPSEIRSAGGFFPNKTRDDQAKKLDGANLKYSEESALNLQNFLANPFLGGYISLTKSYAVAKHFTAKEAATQDKDVGWVYVCYAHGGYLIPEQGWYDVRTKTSRPDLPGVSPEFQWNPQGDEKQYYWRIKFKEQEISVPGAVGWEDVVACRQVSRLDQGGVFLGDVFMRKSFYGENTLVAQEILRLLSGKSQGPGLLR